MEKKRRAQSGFAKYDRDRLANGSSGKIHASSVHKDGQPSTANKTDYPCSETFVTSHKRPSGSKREVTSQLSGPRYEAAQKPAGQPALGDYGASSSAQFVVSNRLKQELIKTRPRSSHAGKPARRNRGLGNLLRDNKQVATATNLNPSASRNSLATSGRWALDGFATRCEGWSQTQQRNKHLEKNVCISEYSRLQTSVKELRTQIDA
jgi:hypothetical protein